MSEQITVDLKLFMQLTSYAKDLRDELTWAINTGRGREFCADLSVNIMKAEEEIAKHGV